MFTRVMSRLQHDVRRASKGAPASRYPGLGSLWHVYPTLQQLTGMAGCSTIRWGHWQANVLLLARVFWRACGEQQQLQVLSYTKPPVWCLPCMQQVI